MKRLEILVGVLVALAAGDAWAFGEPQPFPNYSTGWVCNDGSGCLKITNSSTTGNSETLRLVSASGYPLITRTGDATHAGQNSINAQNLSTTSTVSVVYAGHAGNGNAFNGRTVNAPAADFSSQFGDGMVSSITTSGKSAGSFSNGSTTGGNALYAYMHGSSGYAVYADGNVNVTGHLYVNGVEVTELFQPRGRTRMASVLPSDWAVVALCVTGVVVSVVRRRRQASGSRS